MTRRLVGAGAALLGVTLLTPACGPGPRESAEMIGDHEVISVDEAARFAGFELPQTAEAVGAYRNDGRDRLVAFALRVDAGDLPGLLAAADFVEPLSPGRRVFQDPVDGVEVEGVDDFSSAQDTRQVGRQLVVRDVLVVHHRPDSALLHVWAFTT